MDHDFCRASFFNDVLMLSCAQDMIFHVCIFVSLAWIFQVAYTAFSRQDFQIMSVSCFIFVRSRLSFADWIGVHGFFTTCLSCYVSSQSLFVIYFQDMIFQDIIFQELCLSRTFFKT